VIIGANSGIGFEACKILATTNKRQVKTLVLDCRSLAKAQDAINRIRAAIPPGEISSTCTLIPAECDLESLDSIKSFAEVLPGLLVENDKLDVVCLNAGLCRKAGAADVVRIKDGFELTGKKIVDAFFFL
jgi:NAD(P)-dependent dehydrogenase (short-subunit alcohol dehydrogenase family)